jgi:hypothetical protein
MFGREKESDKSLVRYRCLQSLNNGKYGIQSADFYSVPLDAKAVSNLESQFVELLAEQDPLERAGEHDSLEDAIRAHELDFG